VLIVPAIDIRGGKCVRLYKGDYAQETVFGADPSEMARRWVREGATALHLVDLDGAKSGKSDNFRAVEAILAAVSEEASVPVEVDLGGGIRDEDGVGRWLDAGLHHVILGTSAVRDPDLVSRCAVKHPARIWVGIDARGGKVAISGWTEDSGIAADALARDVEQRGAAGIVYTDIDRDGTGDGVNVEATRALASELGIPVYASGGVRTTADVERLLAAQDAGVAGVIVGRALYDGAVTLEALLAAAA
jgi:phosphoribosylformimino-5-aminoimidazole carboxamide ribotide isomerase